MRYENKMRWKTCGTLMHGARGSDDRVAEEAEIGDEFLSIAVRL